MMPKLRWTSIALLALSGMTTSCAASLPGSADPPRLILPDLATTPCILHRLRETPTQADLEIAYIERGVGLVACESARALAVDTLLAERALQDQWRRETRARQKRSLWPWQAGHLSTPRSPSTGMSCRPPGRTCPRWQVLPGSWRGGAQV